ncbi:nucleotide-diphospho-sugar transferase [Epithele typhae]|uniref:nucleotide-diphospho-sugar transferase n=1 Tax=Epithele typhae TaxID=378194 RepID=UPI002008A85B|nr:nucleotide-diphospho-sugar transferase [Epithele typhae]KAH9942141.1 nucleotide-diphospho-sugar transferase [Epithele typhae]
MFKLGNASYRDYIPLPRWEGEARGGGGPRRDAASPRRRALVFGLLAASLLVNVRFVWVLATAWPAPLDDYQGLRPRALASTRPVNPQDHAIVTGLYTDAFASAPTPIERIAPPHAGVHRHFLDQYSKLQLWTLDRKGYKAAVYVDADTLVKRSFDELFRLPYTFAAVPDVYTSSPGYVTAFNAGVLFLRPDSALYADMASKIASARYPPKEAEQAFLNLYFGAEALRLPYAYNANLAIRQRTPALWDALAREARVVHYTMAKPFLQGDYEEVPLAELERNAARVARQKPLFRKEIDEWVAAWGATKRAYGAELERCEGLSRKPGVHA